MIMFLSDEGPTLELYYPAHIGSTPTFLYFDLSLNINYAAHYIYLARACVRIQSQD